MQRSRVGVLMVHGIGQQARYGHLEPEVASIGRALVDYTKEHGLPPPVIRARSHAPNVRGAIHASWGDQGRAPAVIELRTAQGLIELYFHEVWWADLDDELSLSTLVRFYGWAWGMWLKPELSKFPLGGQARMRHATSTKTKPSWFSKVWYRAYLALVALVVFLAIPVAIVFRFVRIMIPTMPLTLLAEYLGDVKLYQDFQRVGKPRLEDLDLPPRVSIRARMIHALVEMALADYDRWYICAHSLGSVIAFNGLMETEQCLPNYLDQDALNRAVQAGLVVETNDQGRQLSARERQYMLPPRTYALTPESILDRNLLFRSLRGILTYGCPLERFRVLWPDIIPINREQEARAFSPALKWFNLFDPSDPVSSELKSFAPQQPESHPRPENIPYRSAWVHLIAHISYLRWRKGASAVRSLTHWLVEESTDRWKDVELSTGHRFVRQLLQYGCWVGVLALAVTFVSTVAYGTLGVSVLDVVAVVVRTGAVVVFVSGCVLWLVQRRAEERHERRRIERERGAVPGGGGPSDSGPPSPPPPKPNEPQQPHAP